MTQELLRFVYWTGWLSGAMLTLGVTLLVLAFWMRRGGE